MTPETGKSPQGTRLELVEQHVRYENAHDLEAVMETFSEEPYYDERPWGEHHAGLGAVREHYEQLFRAAPNLTIEILKRYVSRDAVILECEIRGTHLGIWRGLPPTGRQIRFSLCAVYTFTKADKLAGERVYYDRATVLTQLGVLHDPESLLGRALTTITHPITLGRALFRRTRSR